MAAPHRAALLLVLAVVACSTSALAAVTLPTGYRLPNPPGVCNCSSIPTTNTPVCASDGSTYGNECIAQCANVLIVSEGDCPYCKIVTNNCQCGNLPYSPVCSFGLTWTSKCDALCGGYSCPLTPGVCEYNDKGSFVTTTGGTSSAAGAKIAAATTVMPDPTAAKHDYAEALHKTLIFFESMRSGVLDRQRLAWRSDSCFDCKGPSGEDVSGGYYEAGGSFLKLGLVENFLVTLMGYSIDTFPEGFSKGDLQNAIDAMDWGAQYIVKTHSAPNRVVAVLGNSTLDFNYYGPVEEYEQYVASRPSCYIDEVQRGSEIAGEGAAGLAAAYVVLKAQKQGSAAKLASYLQHAEQLYSLATLFPGSYQTLTSPCLKQLGSLYKSTGFVDELAWAAAWLYKATGSQQYLADARTYYADTCKSTCYSFETGDKGPALNVLMAAIDPANAAAYNANAKAFFRLYLEQIIPYTPGGLAFPYHWGAFRPTTQAAFLALVASKQLRTATGGDAAYGAQLFNWAQNQVGYVLGDSGRSWLSGYGTNFPQYIWHKPSYNSYIDWRTRGVTVFANWSAEQTDGTYKRLLTAPLAKFDMEASRIPQQFIPYGALYGAPLQDDGLIVTRKDFTYAEATTDGTSGITGALAALTEYYATSPAVTAQTDCGLDLGWTHPNATNTPKSINNTAVCLGLPATNPKAVKPLYTAPVTAPISAPVSGPTSEPISEPASEPVSVPASVPPRLLATAPVVAPSTAPAMPTGATLAAPTSTSSGTSVSTAASPSVARSNTTSAAGAASALSCGAVMMSAAMLLAAASGI